MHRSFFPEIEPRYPPWNDFKLKFIRLAYNFDYLGILLALMGLKRQPLYQVNYVKIRRTLFWIPIIQYAMHGKLEKSAAYCAYWVLENINFISVANIRFLHDFFNLFSFFWLGVFLCTCVCTCVCALVFNEAIYLQRKKSCLCNNILSRHDGDLLDLLDL